MALHIDPAATALIVAASAHRTSDAVLSITIERLAVRGAVQTLTFSWLRRDTALRRALMPLEPVAGVPIYAHPRLYRYLQWHGARVTTCRYLWTERLVVAEDIRVLYDLARWEFTHPVLSGRALRPLPTPGYRASSPSMAPGH